MLYKRFTINSSGGYFTDDRNITPRRSGSNSIHIQLFFATLITTTAVGAIMSSANPFSLFGFIRGFPFSISILTILGIHEFAHYFAAKLWGIRVTLPYFIPAPFPPIGTFGAVIKMKSSIPNRKALIDVGASGPLAGFIAAVIASVIGLRLSQVVPEGSAFLILGEPLIFKFLGHLVIGAVPPNHDIMLHPIAFAGWIGLFVTALNLIPIGQLDGGHILFAISPRIHELIRRIRIPILILLGLSFWNGWYVWAVLSLLFGRVHPYPDIMDSSIGPLRQIMAILSVIVFILCVIPTPVKVL
ncbi:hypothetical protein ES708_17697 [subsurface metagenome]